MRELRVVAVVGVLANPCNPGQVPELVAIGVAQGPDAVPGDAIGSSRLLETLGGPGDGESGEEGKWNEEGSDVRGGEFDHDGC